MGDCMASRDDRIASLAATLKNSGVAAREDEMGVEASSTPRTVRSKRRILVTFIGYLLCWTCLFPGRVKIIFAFKSPICRLVLYIQRDNYDKYCQISNVSI